MLQRGSLVGVPLGARRGSVLLDGPSTMAALQVPPPPGYFEKVETSYTLQCKHLTEAFSIWTDNTQETLTTSIFGPSPPPPCPFWTPPVQGCIYVCIDMTLNRSLLVTPLHVTLQQARTVQMPGLVRRYLTMSRHLVDKTPKDVGKSLQGANCYLSLQLFREPL